MVGRRFRREETYVYLWRRYMYTLLYDRSQHNIVKQSSSNEKGTKRTLIEKEKKTLKKKLEYKITAHCYPDPFYVFYFLSCQLSMVFDHKCLVLCLCIMRLYPPFTFYGLKFLSVGISSLNISAKSFSISSNRSKTYLLLV